MLFKRLRQRGCDKKKSTRKAKEKDREDLIFKLKNTNKEELTTRLTVRFTVTIRGLSEKCSSVSYT